MASVRVANFAPKTNGFGFANSWPHVPLYEFQLGALAKLTIGDAANGLCGGMSFTVADLHAVGLAPGTAAQPTAGASRYNYIVERQIQSFAGIAVLLRFYSLMRADRPDREPLWAEWLGQLGGDRHSRSYTMVHQEWPRIRADLDSGRLSMIGLIRIVDDDPFKLNHNHQVLAYGYDLDGSQLTLLIHDPNWPNDEVTLRLDTADPRALVTTTYSKPDAPVVCFFRAPYVARDPGPWR
jgi:hypothetical protein